MTQERKERRLRRKIGQSRPKLIEQFDACLKCAKDGVPRTTRDFSSDAFSNAVREQPCCKSLADSLPEELLEEVRSCFNYYKS